MIEAGVRVISLTLSVIRAVRAPQSDPNISSWLAEVIQRQLLLTKLVDIYIISYIYSFL